MTTQPSCLHWSELIRPCTGGEGTGQHSEAAAKVTRAHNGIIIVLVAVCSIIMGQDY